MRRTAVILAVVGVAFVVSAATHLHGPQWFLMAVGLINIARIIWVAGDRVQQPAFRPSPMIARLLLDAL